MSEKNLFLIAYIPVIHQGYISLLNRRYSEIEHIYLLSDVFIAEHTFLEREIRALSPATALAALQGLGFNRSSILGHADFPLCPRTRIIIPNEALMRRFAENYLTGSTVEYDNTFLMWDESHIASQAPVTYDRISEDPFDRAMMAHAQKEGAESSDWWRRVGAISTNGVAILLRGHNTHMPSEYSPYAFGDIRDFIKAGTQSDISSALHAEQVLITKAAAEGIALRGSNIYVSVFPCPTCAKWIAEVGIKKCFYGSGHASFDGEKNLKAKGVEIIYVK